MYLWKILMVRNAYFRGTWRHYDIDINIRTTNYNHRRRRSLNSKATRTNPLNVRIYELWDPIIRCFELASTLLMPVEETSAKNMNMKSTFPYII